MMVTKMPQVTESTPAPQHQPGKCQKDESSVNREIATLLLNLASRTQNSALPTATQQQRDFETEAMDLSKYSRSRDKSGETKTSSSPSVAYSRSHLSSPLTSSPSSSCLNPYSLLSPGIGPGIGPGINNLGSSYLLQNLLIGQIQNLASPPPHSTSSALMQTDQKSPTNLSSADTTAATLPESNPTSGLLSKGLSVAGVSPESSHIPALPLTNLGTSIPLLSGHIVAQLNSLLFSVHGLNDKSLELNIQGQLAAIYTRLQEIVSMINVAKKKEVKSKSEAEVKQTGPPPSDEQKINKKLEEYQRALYQSSQPQTSTQPLKLEVRRRRSGEEARRRTSKEREMVAGDSGPQEKKARPNPESGSRASSPPAASSTKSKSGGKGGKGIRNRVFCGDCPGCLKNDDCGQCRYCRDKTKFGGQNRLRQKCLHRRCQMDTHRRSGGLAGQSGGRVTSPSSEGVVSVSTSPAEIYSGVDLARYTGGGGGGGGGNDADVAHHHSIFSSLLATPLSAPTEEPGQTRSDKWKLKHEAMLTVLSARHTEGDTLKENTENQAVSEEGEKERNSGRTKSLERNTKVKSSDSKKEVGRLTTRSMKPAVLAL